MSKMRSCPWAGAAIASATMATPQLRTGRESILADPHIVAIFATVAVESRQPIGSAIRRRNF
jgi:hypothetical protein